MPNVDVWLLSGRRRLVVRAWLAATVTGLGVLGPLDPSAPALGGGGVNRFADRWLYDALELLAAGGCLLRAAWVRGERSVWTLLGLGGLSYCVGDILFDFVFGGNPPTPSVADGFYLAFYPGCYAALLLLVRSRISVFNRSVRLDGLIAALVSAAVAAAVVFELVLENTHGHPFTVVVDLAYPLGDVLLLGLTVFAFAVTGWRPQRAWSATPGAALIAITVADSLYLVRSATGSYHEVQRTLMDALWPASLLLLAAAAWQRNEREHSRALEWPVPRRRPHRLWVRRPGGAARRRSRRPSTSERAGRGAGRRHRSRPCSSAPPLSFGENTALALDHPGAVAHRLAHEPSPTGAS